MEISHAKRVACAATIALCLALAAGCLEQARAAESGRLEEVMKSVGRFVLGRAETFPENISDLYRAYKEFKRLPEHEQRALAERRPLNKLIVDFAIKPMKFVKVLIGDHELAAVKYLERMRAVLRAFYPAYRGVQFSNVSPIEKRPKMDELCSILFRTRDDDHDDQPLKLRHFLQAKWERNAWLSRAQQIIDHEDVFSNLDEYARILQYLNREDYKLIHKFILPRVWRGADAAELRRLFDATPDLNEPSVEYALA